ncbi:hypothetical protein T12_8234 [Trichinella patagoniensis]|uniref:Uncharacterized protein n=1 Tax=Trichinella patagoniensis TaxID=990121 RepID=A0A0V0ZWP1_9BILA|nr:hypothetical protein T12_8234 [Trichinella patagoniensis]
MEKFPHMSGMPIILGTIQRAVMDTVHLVGQGVGGGEREKAGMKICDVEWDFRDGRSDHLTQKRMNEIFHLLDN